jgi:hypothetical protein
VRSHEVATSANFEAAMPQACQGMLMSRSPPESGTCLRDVTRDGIGERPVGESLFGDAQIACFWDGVGCPSGPRP